MLRTSQAEVDVGELVLQFGRQLQPAAEQDDGMAVDLGHLQGVLDPARLRKADQGHAVEGAVHVVTGLDASVGVGAGVAGGGTSGGLFGSAKGPNRQADRRAMFNPSGRPLFFLEGGSCVPVQATNAGTDAG